MRFIILFFACLILVSCITDSDYLPKPEFEVVKIERDDHYFAVFINLTNDNPKYNVYVEVSDVDGWVEKINTDRAIVCYPVGWMSPNFRVRYEYKRVKSDWSYWK